MGGSTDLQKGPGYYAGDLSGITAKKAPFWFQPFYKPGKKIAKERDWNKKLKEIVEKAPNWDIGFIIGVPAWIQMCLEMVIERYKLNNIHEIWPNLTFFVHGGVSFEPYKIGFEKLLGKPITYVETYLASRWRIQLTNLALLLYWLDISQRTHHWDGAKRHTNVLIVRCLDEVADCRRRSKRTCRNCHLSCLSDRFGN